MPSDVRFAEIKKKLEKHGWTHRPGKGSHNVFNKPGGPTLVIPVHAGKVKPVYVRQVQDAIKSLEGGTREERRGL